jgi:uncharacterized membrane protein YvbJ
MSYCPKCGNKVDETMAFCPRCGASLKGQITGQPVQPSPMYRRQEKAEKNQNPEKGEKQEKAERGFAGYLIGGLILIIIGVFSLLQLSGNNYFGSGSQGLAVMLFIIGIVIIFGAVYVALTSRKHFPKPAV